MVYSEKEILAIFKILLEKKFVDYHKIISWTDAVIIENELFSDYFIDLSLAGGKGSSEIMRILETISNEIHSDLIWKTIYGFLAYQFKIKQFTLKEACTIADNFALDYENLSENYILEGRGLWDVYYLAENNIYGTFENAEERFLEVTGKHEYLWQIFNQKYLNF